MKSRLFVLALFVVCQSILIGLGIGEGYFIHWLIPAIELGTAILVAEMATIAMAFVFVQILNSAAHRELQWQAEREQQDEEAESEDGAEDLEHVYMHLSSSPLLSRPPRSRPKRKRK